MGKKDSNQSFVTNDNKICVYSSRAEETAPNHNQNENIANIDGNLKTMEDHIIEDAIKYTGSKQGLLLQSNPLRPIFKEILFLTGISDPDEIEELKSHVISRLITAYDLEKLRRVLSKLKKTREDALHFDENEIPDSTSVQPRKSEKTKRVAVKKEKVEYDNTQ